MKIEIKDNPNESDLKFCEYPLDFQYVGREESDEDFKILIQQETLRRVDDYLSSDTNNELGGVLIGDVCVNREGRKFILIDDLIIAKHSSSSLSRLTFTHETWSYINEVLERDFPNKKILGWFHSHPGHTVFMSTFDIFIQENFFNMDYMVAYVYDPTIKDRGFFFLKDKKIIKSNGFYIYDIKKKDGLEDLTEFKSVIDLPNNKNSVDKIKKTLDNNFKNNLILGILLLNLLLLILIIYNYYELKKRILLREDYVRDLIESKSETQKLKEKLDNLIVDIELKKNSVIPSTIDSSFIKYVVKKGDNLKKIAMEFFKDEKRTDVIIKQNNLKGEIDIKPGQILEIPKLSK